jgi:hypothetical protein
LGLASWDGVRVAIRWLEARGRDLDPIVGSSLGKKLLGVLEYYRGVTASIGRNVAEVFVSLQRTEPVSRCSAEKVTIASRRGTSLRT